MPVSVKWTAMLKEYVAAVFRHAIAQLAGVLGVLLTVISLAAPGKVTRIAGLALIALAVIGGQFWAWLDIRKERDAAIADFELTRDSVRFGLRLADVQAQISIDERQPNLADVQVRLFFENTSSVVLQYEVESMLLVFGGYTSSSPVFNTTGGNIAPSKTDGFFYPEIHGVSISPPPSGEVEFSIVYGPAGQRPRFRWRWSLSLHLRQELGQAHPNRVDRLALMPETHELLP